MKKFLNSIVILFFCFGSLMSIFPEVCAARKLVIANIKTPLSNMKKAAKIEKLSNNFRIYADRVGSKITYNPKKIYAAPICLYPWIEVDLEKNTVSLKMTAQYFSEYAFNSGPLVGLGSGSDSIFDFNRVLVRTDEGLHKINYDRNNMSVQRGHGYARVLFSASASSWIEETYKETMDENTFYTFIAMINSKNKVYIKFESDLSTDYVDKELKPKHLKAFRNVWNMFNVLRS